MAILKSIAWLIIILYGVTLVLLYVVQTKLIFYPGSLSKDLKFRLGENDEEIYLETADGEKINALFYSNRGPDVVLYFHGNAGDLSGWQFVAEDFTALGLNVLLIDYRGYGKSSGSLSEKGMYLDAEAAWQFLLDKGFAPENIIIFGRSIGSGVAVELSSKHKCKGLVLESPFSSLGRLANEKLPFFFPSLYLKFRFDNIGKISKVQSPAILLHGTHDTLIPPAHSQRLFENLPGRKKLIIVNNGAHNDLNAFREYEEFLKEVLPAWFEVTESD